MENTTTQKQTATKKTSSQKETTTKKQSTTKKETTTKKQETTTKVEKPTAAKEVVANGCIYWQYIGDGEEVTFNVEWFDKSQYKKYEQGSVMPNPCVGDVYQTAEYYYNYTILIYYCQGFDSSLCNAPLIMRSLAVKVVFDLCC